MNIVSLFDGISVARYALDVAGIPVAKYYSAEICPHAIKVSDKNYPNIIRLGDVKNVQLASIAEPIDLLIGGSPCQDLSIAGKRKGLAGERSGLFYEYVRIKNELKPKHFILENVYSMSSVDRDIITGILGVEPVMFNASLVSAQSRKRLFWTDIKFDLPQDKGIILKDILQACSDIDPKMLITGKSYTPSNGTPVIDSTKPVKIGIVNGGTQGQQVFSPDGKSTTLSTLGGESVALPDSQGNRVYSDDGKSVTLSSQGGGVGSKTGLYKVGRIVGRRLDADGKRDDNNKDIKIVQQVEVRPDDKSGTLTTVSKDNVVVNQITKNPKDNKGLFFTDTNELAVVEGTKQGFAIVDNNNSVDLSYANCKTTRRGRVGDKVKNLMTTNNIFVNQDYNVRKLTPIECERLQSLPDDYTEGVAKTHRYKCLGNAFNAEVIAHILKSGDFKKVN